MAKVTPQELTLLEGATSNIQDQIDAIIVSSGGAAISTITTATLSGDVVITQDYVDAAGGGSAAISGYSCSITTTHSNEVVLLDCQLSAKQTVSSDLLIGYQIDSNTPVSLIYYKNIDIGVTRTVMPISKFITIATPGTYTLKLTASRTSTLGNPTVEQRVAGGTSTELIPMTVVQFSGSGGGSAIVDFQTVAIPGNETISSSFGQVASYQATVTVNSTSDVIDISFSGFAQWMSLASPGQDRLMGYQVDSDTAIKAWYIASGSTAFNAHLPIAWDRKITGLSAGSHTIKLMAGTNGSANWTLVGDNNAFGDGGVVHFDVTVFRG